MKGVLKEVERVFGEPDRIIKDEKSITMYWKKGKKIFSMELDKDLKKRSKRTPCKNS